VNKPGIVYALQERLTLRIYVGSTRNLKDRIYAHMIQLVGGKHPVEDMQADFNRSRDMLLYILWSGECSDQVLRKIEQLHMDALETRNQSDGYNYKDPSSDFDLSRCACAGIDADNVAQAVAKVLADAKMLDAKQARAERSEPAYPSLTIQEKALVDQIAELPADVQDKFLLMAQGAAVAVDCARAAETKDEGDADE
jgi:hypothetical protein